MNHTPLISMSSGSKALSRILYAFDKEVPGKKPERLYFCRYIARDGSKESIVFSIRLNLHKMTHINQARQNKVNKLITQIRNEKGI